MLDWDSVNDTKTPSAYSGIRAFVSAWKIRINSEATPASTMMPLVKTSRLPRYVSCLGRKPSPA